MPFRLFTSLGQEENYRLKNSNLHGMNLLLADSGSTKTDWRLVEQGSTLLSVRTKGFNPYLLSTEEIVAGIREELLPALNGALTGQVFFYGAGCGAPDKRAVVASALREVFPLASVDVETDLLGAARALCGNEPGIAAILGTGSNSCVYDGQAIADNRPSLGYVLGDEGGGAAIGKQLLRLFLYGEMDTELRSNFVQRFPIDRNAVLDHIYRQPHPNRYLASFAKFVFQNIGQPQCQSIVIENFRAFFRHHILRYEKAHELPLHVTGSIGFYFSNLLRRVAEEEQVRLGRVTETPIAGLVNFHSGH